MGFLYVFQIGTLKKIKSTDTKYFTWFLCTLSLIVLFFFLVDLNIKFRSITIVILLLVVPLSLLLGPLMWLYIRKLISYEKGKRPIFHFLPAIIIGFLVISLSTATVLVPKENLELKAKLIEILTIIAIGSLVGVFLIQNVCYIILSIRGYRRHRKKMEQIYSYSEEVDLSWVKILVVGYVVFIIGVVLVNSIKGEDVSKVKNISSYHDGVLIETLKTTDLKTGDKVNLDGYSKDNKGKNYKIRRIDNHTFFIEDLPYDKKEIYSKTILVKSPNKSIAAITNVLFDLIILFYIIYTGHHAIKQKTIVVRENEINETESAEEEKDKVFSETQLLVFQKIKEELLEVMKTEKPYLDQNLNIFTLSKRLNTNSKYLSQVINQEFNKSFVHFVNEYRIEEAKQILLVNNNYTIEAQSQMVGFKSKSSFNIAFKKHTGVTPSLFIQGNR